MVAGIRRPWLLLLALLYVGLLVLALPEWLLYRRLASVGISTSGEIVEIFERNHNAVRYQFTVADRRYEGIGIPGLASPEVTRRIGTQVPVVYLPGNPGKSVIGDPAQLRDSWSGLLFIFGPLLLAFAVGVARARFLHARQESGSPNERARPDKV